MSTLDNNYKSKNKLKLKIEKYLFFIIKNELTDLLSQSEFEFAIEYVYLDNIL